MANFGQALEGLKLGAVATRTAWGRDDVFIFLRPADELNVLTVIDNVKSLPASVKDYFESTGDRQRRRDLLETIKFSAYLCKKDLRGDIQNGWTPSQDDMLAEDWGVIGAFGLPNPVSVEN